ncbi:MAG: diguanylate cyclase, partial [Planctomycetes bacterium]|nr:diguanylate cyclase [Planctomycetota bacterium]
QWLKSEVEKAYHDALTGIYNRRYFDENINRIVKSLARSSAGLSLMMIDIDHFKLYNDTYGHAAGDECLRIVAEIITQSISRSDDFVARYGGEEFVVVLPNTDADGAELLAEKMLDNIRRRHLPHHQNKASDRVTISIGVTSGEVEPAHNGDLYVRRADKLLYMSKQNGRNRYTFAPLKEGTRFLTPDKDNSLIESAKRALDVAERRSVLVGALNDAIGILCRHREDSFDEVLSNGLRPMAEVMRIHRIIVLRKVIADGEERLKQLYRWDKVEDGLTTRSFTYLPKIPSTEGLINTVLRNECVNRRLSDMPEAERAFHKPFGVKSLLAVPVFTHGEIWGAVVYQDHENERLFDEDCMDLYRSSALLFANAIIRADMTRNAQEAFDELKNQNLRLNLLLEGMDVALWDMIIPQDRNPFAGDNEFWWSDEFRRLLGFSDEKDFPNKHSSWSSRIHPEDKERVLAAVSAHMYDASGKTPLDMEYRLMLKNGQYRSFRAFGQTQRSRTGAPLRIAGALEDISERERAREALKRRELLLGAINDMAAILLSHHEYTAFDEVMSRGIKPIVEVIGIDSVSVYQLLVKEAPFKLRQIYLWHEHTVPLEFDVIEVPEVPATQRWHETLLSGGCLNVDVSKTSPVEEAFYNRFGIKAACFTPVFIREEYWGVIAFVDYANYRSFDEDEVKGMRSAAYLCALAIMRREKDQALAEKDELNRIMFNNAPVGLTVFDENFRCLDCNENVLAMYGVTREFYRDFFGSAAHSPECQPDGSPSREKALAVIRRVFNGETMRIEWLHLTPGGEHLPVELTMIRARQGDKYVGLGYIYDMREQHRLKAEIAAALVKEREAGRAKTDFLSRMSHEMRTPMNTIIGMTQIAKMQGLPDNMNKCLDEIETMSGKLLGLIEDVLDISDLEYGIYKTDTPVFSFRKMFQSIYKNALRHTAEKRQLFTYDLDQSLPEMVQGDAKRLSRVIKHILDNAIKFTPEQGKIHFAAQVLREDAGTITLQAEITDNGIGMSEEQQKGIFTLFEQADVSPTRSHGGVGLGLTLAKLTVEMLGGRISVASEPGKGSKFTFTCNLRIPPDLTGRDES